MKRILRLAALALTVVLLFLIPASGKYIYNFSFGLGTMSTAGLPVNNASADAAAANAQQGFDVVYSASHVFTADTLNGVSNYYSGGSVKAVTNYRQGWYAFVMRGGDGGAGRNNGSAVASYGGMGGIVMGVVYLEGGKTLYIAAGCSGVGVYAGSVTDDMGKINGGTTTAWYKYNSFYGGGWSNTNNGGGGGGCSFIALGDNASVYASPSTGMIAVAGGGGGGGGMDASGSDANGNGGDAGASANPSGPSGNPILNGYNTAIAGTIVYNTGGVTGLVSPGIQGRVRANGLKSTTNPGDAGSSVQSNDGGGGGGATQGGTGGVYQQALNGGSFLQGGRGSHSASLGGAGGTAGLGGGGGGAGWYGGGGGGRHTSDAKYHGGGGGGSSFVRSDVLALNSTMLASPYFAAFATANSGLVDGGAGNDANFRYKTAQGTGTTDTTAWIIGDSSYYTLNMRSMIGGSTGNYKFSGMRGFVVMKYLGPKQPGTYSQYWSSWPF